MSISENAVTYIIMHSPNNHTKGALTLAFVGPFRLLRLAYLTFFVSRQERWKRWHFFVRLHRSHRSWREKKGSWWKRREFGACSKVRTVCHIWVGILGEEGLRDPIPLPETAQTDSSSYTYRPTLAPFWTFLMSYVWVIWAITKRYKRQCKSPFTHVGR